MHANKNSSLLTSKVDWSTLEEFLLVVKLLPRDRITNITILFVDLIASLSVIS